MSMYFARIDLFKYKHDCYIIAVADQSIIAKFTFKKAKRDLNSSLLVNNC